MSLLDQQKPMLLVLRVQQKHMLYTPFFIILQIKTFWCHGTFKTSAFSCTNILLWLPPNSGAKIFVFHIMFKICNRADCHKIIWQNSVFGFHLFWHLNFEKSKLNSLQNFWYSWNKVCEAVSFLSCAQASTVYFDIQLYLSFKTEEEKICFFPSFQFSNIFKLNVNVWVVPTYTLDPYKVFGGWGFNYNLCIAGFLLVMQAECVCDISLFYFIFIRVKKILIFS